MTPYADYKDLVSQEDWDKYFEGKNIFYNDPLKFALVRTMEKLIKALEDKT